MKVVTNKLDYEPPFNIKIYSTQLHDISRACNIIYNIYQLYLSDGNNVCAHMEYGGHIRIKDIEYPLYNLSFG